MGRSKSARNDVWAQRAREQGWRARSAFKLLQLNRKYDFLSTATRAIDLCAAPGGWMQVCAHVMPKTAERQIIGVDLLPIKPIRGCKAFQSDITTDECRRIIRKELAGNKADVVLCDGAPNVGAEFSKDSFVQNELLVHSVRFATDHLAKGSALVMKIFRSVDAPKIMWLCKQLFKTVVLTKPQSSRTVSSEAFIVARGYLAPHKIDPRLLDPRYILDTTDENTKLGEQAAINMLFSKKHKQKRHRTGYDDALGQTLFTSIPAIEFLKTTEPIQMLATKNALTFEDDESAKYLDHPLTTEEVKHCMKDLKVLGSSDLRLLLRWRSKIRHQETQEKASAKAAELAKAAEGETDGEAGDDDGDNDEDDTMDVDEEISRIRAEQAKKRKREIKRLRREAAKLQRRKDLGMEGEFALDVSEMEGPFSSSGAGVKSARKLGEIVEDDKRQVVDRNALDSDEESELEEEEYLEGEDRLRMLEEEASRFYSSSRKEAEAIEPLTVQQMRQERLAKGLAKAKKKDLEAKAALNFELALEEERIRATGQHVAGGSDNDDDDDSVVVSDDEAEPNVAKEVGTEVDHKRAKRWFDQALFDGAEASEDEDDDEGDELSSSDEDEEADLDEDDEESDLNEEDMPLPSQRTDKHKRAIKRAKLAKRNERKAEKRKLREEREARAVDPNFVAQSKEIEVVPGQGDSSSKKRSAQEAGLQPESDDEESQLKPRWARTLIRKGMGAAVDEEEKDTGFEVVRAKSASNDDDDDLDMEDDEEEEKYNSEDYDSDTRAQHLALGALLVKKTTRRKVLDAVGYNRWVHNDPDDMPDWWVEDQQRHNRPIVPVTKEMVEAVKERFKDLSKRSINKVAEARARKKRRMQSRIEKAKKKATAILEEPDTSTRTAMRQIESLYKKASRPEQRKVAVVVSRKGGAKNAKNNAKKLKGAKVKVVDRRQKADVKRGRKGKAGGGGKKSYKRH